ncbi:MAG: S8 family serine peptidase, partial [Candidatus Competibacteraceae bacterium]|nr:S8 family serine peptidase [Candidatus Competibacteraceae bacterium]
LEPVATANDPYYPNAWHLGTVGVPQAWDRSTGSGVSVAVLDTGVDASHPDLSGQLLLPGYNAVDQGSDTADLQGHGTLVAGVVVAATNNGLGVASVAHGARVRPVRVSNRSDGMAYISHIARGIVWAIDNGARVINISYDVPGSSAISDAARYAVAHNGVVVVAAGNSGTDLGYADDPYIIAVSATDPYDNKTSWSSYGPYVDLSAPGAGIYTTVQGGGYGASRGTSFDSPLTAAVVALIMARDPDLTPEQIEQLLEQTAVDQGSPGFDSLYGWGRVDAAAALAALQPQIQLTVYTDLVTVHHDWARVMLPGLEGDPVVIAGVPTFHGTHPGVVRLQNIRSTATETYLELRFAEWDYKDYWHVMEDIPLMVLPAGRYQGNDGSLWEAGTFDLNGNKSWQATDFIDSFPGQPELFLTVQTSHDQQTVAVRARDLTTQGFKAALFEQDAFVDGHGIERIGYLAIYDPRKSGSLTINGGSYPYLLARESLKHVFSPVLSHALKIEEERSLDSETEHLMETLSVLAVGDLLFAQDITSVGMDTAALRRIAPEQSAPMEWGSIPAVGSDWVTVPLVKGYASPVVVARVGEQNDPAPGVVRIRNVTSDSFQVRFQEWDYLDDVHQPERIFYMVADQGTSQVAGLRVTAGRLDTDRVLGEGSASVSFAVPFATAPALFTSVMTANESDAVTTRVQNISTGGFGIAMQEQESGGSHASETLGWIALEYGSGETSDGRRIKVFDTVVDHNPLQVTFGQSFRRSFPTIVADINGVAGSNTVKVAQTGLTWSSVELFLQEEQSADAETVHIPETVSIFVAE